MKISIVYSSVTGNTKLLAEAVKKSLSNLDCVYFGEPSIEALNADRIYIGFWTDKGNCDSKTADFIKEIKNKEIFLFGTAGFGQETSYFDRILNNTKSKLDETNNVIGTFMCQGKMPISVRNRYVAMQNSPKPIPNLEKLIDNFDEALSHPDENDLLNLKSSLSNTL